MFKRLLLGIMCMFLVVSLSSCKVAVKEDQAKEILIKIASKHLSKYVLRNNPQLIDEVEFYCKAMADQEITQGVLNIAKDKLIELAGNDPALKSDLDDILSLVVIDMESPDFNMDYVYSALEGFIEGAELARLKI